MNDNASNTWRRVVTTVKATDVTDGEGVAISRIHGLNALTDPFLLIDEIQTTTRDAIAGGFPPHPHRGFETLTYVREGGFKHEDHLGNRGEISTGGAQWMRAGRGIIHSEMPVEGHANFHGFQLWINLPAALKMSAPQWRDLPAAPEAHFENTTVISVVGDLTELGERRIGANDTDVHVLDVQFSAPEPAQEPLMLHTIAHLRRVLVKVYSGVVDVGGTPVVAGSMAVLNEEGVPALSSRAPGSAALIIAGQPINEPVVQLGPFVMNSEEEVRQAMEDYRTGKLTLAP